LHMADRALVLEGHKANLAKWLRDQALAMNRPEMALSAAEQAFRAEVSLVNYQQVAEIAGEQWAGRRTALLEYIRSKRSSNQQGVVDIFLHEELLDDAIAALKPYAGHTLTEQVVDVVLKAQSHLDWVIQTSREQAEYIMDGGKSSYYYSAGKWLSRARTAYQAAGRNGDWQAYLSELLSKHGRKRNFVPILKDLARR